MARRLSRLTDERSARPWTVSDLAGHIKEALAEHLPAKVRVLGEISNLSQRAHWFFSLKDEAAVIRCVCFGNNARRIGFDVQDGMEVVATGRIDFYDGQGQVQLYVDALEPVGLGALEQRLRALCEQLRELGYFDPVRKKALPLMAERIAVVTSAAGAAVQDVINTASRRWPGCQLLLLDVPVQGAAAAPRIAEALRQLGRTGSRLGIDAILLTRGGGSLEDLWAFNEREVADAIFNCPIPIVAAIGHETDTTVAELVADARAATPTQAAMLLVPDRQALHHQLGQMRQRLTSAMTRQVRHGQQVVDALARHPLLRRPEQLVQDAARRASDLAARLQRAMPQRLQRWDTDVKNLAQRLEGVNPSRVLGRGYSYTLGVGGEVLRRPDQAPPGARITTVLAEGRLHSVVEGATPAPQPLTRRRRPRRDEGPDLFAPEAKPTH